MASSEPHRVRSIVASDGAEDPFIGRRRELEAMRRSLAAAASGRGRLDVVSGAPGIGKTRLAQEVTAIARGRGFFVLRGGAWEGEGAPAYWPWADLLRNHLGTMLEERDGQVIDFNSLLEIAATAAGVPARALIDASKDAQQARFMQFDRFCEFLATLAKQQPLLVVFDDAHYADTGSLLLLQFIAERLAKLPIFLLLTSREPLSDLAASTTRHAWSRHVVLRGLARAEAREILEGGNPSGAIPSEISRLLDLADGNPYFLRELRRLVGTDGLAGPTGIALPASVLAVSLQNFNRLKPHCRSLLQTASTMGREFEVELVASAAGLPLRSALATLDEAVHHQIVTPLDKGHYRFTHAMIREAIYDDLHSSERLRLHERILLTLEAQIARGNSVSASTLSHHAFMSLPLTSRRTAGDCLIRAGMEAYIAYAYEEAVLHLKRAFDVLSPTSLIEAERCDLLLHLGAAEAGAGQWISSRRTFQDAAQLARIINSPDRFARAALGFKGLMLATVPADVEAIALLEEAKELLGSEYPDLQVEIYSSLSLSLYFSGAPDLVHAYSTRAVQLAQTLDRDRLTALAVEAELASKLQPGEVGHVHTIATELLRLGTRIRDPVTSLRASLYRYWASQTTGDAHQASQELRRATELAALTHHPRHLWQIALLKTSEAIARGQLSDLDRLSNEARELGRRVHDSAPAQHEIIQLFQRMRLTLEFEPWSNTTPQASDHYPHIIGYLAGQALLHAKLNRLEEARTALRFFAGKQFKLGPPDLFCLYFLGGLAEAVVACQESDWASDLYTELLPYRHLRVVAGLGTVLDGSVEHYLGLLARCMGHSEIALRHFAAAIEGTISLNAPPLVARTQLDYARLLADRADNASRHRAMELAQAASRTFQSAGLTAYHVKSNELIAELSHNRPSTRSLSGATGCDARNAIERVGDLWMVRYSGVEKYLRHQIGFSYIAAILQASGKDVHVLDLVRAGRRLESTESQADFEPGQVALPGADLTAKKAYQHRLESVVEEIESAKKNNDLGRLDALQLEYDALVSELAYSYGLSGRARPHRSAVERARISVRNRVSSALRSLKTHHPDAYRHLSRSIKTGVLCSYAPDFARAWRV